MGASRGAVGFWLTWSFASCWGIDGTGGLGIDSDVTKLSKKKKKMDLRSERGSEKKKKRRPMRNREFFFLSLQARSGDWSLPSLSLAFECISQSYDLCSSSFAIEGAFFGTWFLFWSCFLGTRLHWLNRGIAAHTRDFSSRWVSPN